MPPAEEHDLDCELMGAQGFFLDEALSFFLQGTLDNMRRRGFLEPPLAFKPPGVYQWPERDNLDSYHRFYLTFDTPLHSLAFYMLWHHFHWPVKGGPQERQVVLFNPTFAGSACLPRHFGILQQEIATQEVLLRMVASLEPRVQHMLGRVPPPGSSDQEAGDRRDFRQGTTNQRRWSLRPPHMPLAQLHDLVCELAGAEVVTLEETVQVFLQGLMGNMLHRGFMDPPFASNLQGSTSGGTDGEMSTIIASTSRLTPQCTR